MQAVPPLTALAKPLMPGRHPIAPRSVNDLRRALQAAPVGSAGPDDSGLDRVLGFDAERGLVEVQAALGWPALGAFLATYDVAYGALANYPGVGRSIGAHVAANSPGPDGRPVVAQLESLALVMPDGELRRASRQLNPELFSLAVGGHGLFGVLYSVTLRTASLRASLAAQSAPGHEDARPPVGHGLDIQLLLPPATLHPLLGELRARAEDWRLAVSAVELRRTLPEDETTLRWARQEYAALRVRFTAPPTLGSRVRVAQLEHDLIDLAIEHGGSFPIATTRHATRAQIEMCYPNLGTFLAEKRRYDPLERLQNDWYRHHCALLRSDPGALRWGA